MLANSTLSSDSVITCHQDARFEFAGVRSVYVSGFKFIGCAGNRVESVNEFILEDSSFVGQEDIIGRALELVDTSANIVRSSFNYNKGDNVHLMHHVKCTCLGRSSRRVDVVPIDYKPFSCQKGRGELTFIRAVAKPSN